MPRRDGVDDCQQMAPVSGSKLGVRGRAEARKYVALGPRLELVLVMTLSFCLRPYCTRSIESRARDWNLRDVMEGV